VYDIIKKFQFVCSGQESLSHPHQLWAFNTKPSAGYSL